MDHFEKFGLALMMAFGGMVIAGLMAVSIAWGNKPGFLLALGACVSVWTSSFAVVFEQPRLCGLLTALAIVLVGASITTIVV